MTTLCQRRACEDAVPHRGRAHLDPRNPMYDGPASLFQVLPLVVRESARTIAREHPDVMPEVVDLGNHIQALRGQVAHVSVARDRQVRDAIRRSESCEHHGTEIRLLGEQLHAISESDRRNDQGRVSLLGFLHQTDETIRRYRAGELPKLTLDRLVEALEMAAARAHREHLAAWKQ